MTNGKFTIEDRELYYQLVYKKSKTSDCYRFYWRYKNRQLTKQELAICLNIVLHEQHLHSDKWFMTLRLHSWFENYATNQPLPF